ncbi:MAG: IS3 family transposase [Bacteroidales bacterium]|nr:IS3 family transposase [Bacteroidales bacterium]
MKKELATGIAEEYEVSITRACGLVDIHRSYFYYKSKRDDSKVESAIREAAVFGDGFRKIYIRLRRAGYTWNHKKVYRVYKTMQYNKRSRLKKRLPARVKRPLSQPDSPNTTWSLDFVSDSLECGRKFRVLNIIDDFDRSAVAQEIAISIPAARLIRTLEKVVWTTGKPSSIRCDNGPEFISGIFQEWCKANDINLLYTQPGHPTQNSYIERFNGSYRRAVLDAYIFRTLDDVRKIIEEWKNEYNENRPNDSLGDMSPREYKLNYLENLHNFANPI